MCRKLSPHTVIMDIAMSDLNGMDATRQIRSLDPDIRVIALSAYSDARYVLGMLEAGSWGFVLKSAAGSDLIKALQTVREGKKFLSEELANVVVEGYVKRNYPGRDSAYSALGAKEREVLQLLAEGQSSKEIAENLFISVKTVETHRRNIMRKLDIHSVAELTKYAIREGLTSL
jgi:DNA-binding NarL/FixJ family response regulator